jgi:hypothetical protein
MNTALNQNNSLGRAQLSRRNILPESFFNLEEVVSHSPGLPDSERATLGKRQKKFSTSKRLCQIWHRPLRLYRSEAGHNLFEVDDGGAFYPGLALSESSQPWALGQNLFEVPFTTNRFTVKNCNHT